MMRRLADQFFCAEVDLKRYRSPRFERSTVAGPPAMALKNAMPGGPIMAKLENAFDEGEDFTADDLEGFLASRFLSSTVLGNRKLRLTIAKVTKQALRSDKNGGTELKPVLHFSDSPQQLPLNKTNLSVLNEKLGGDPAAWAGAVIEIFTDPTVKFDGKPALRVKVIKAPTRKPGPTGPGSDERSDTK
jgi:hypothetical protein